MATGRRLLVWILTLLVVAACGQGPEQKQDRELRVGLEDQPKTLDPRYATDAYGMRISHGLIFSSLVEEGYDLQINPGLAERWESPDETTAVFYLRRGVYFHDGEPLTSADVKFTFEHLMDPQTASPFGALFRSEIEVVEVVDSHTVRFRLNRPTVCFLSSLNAPILPEHVIRRQKDFSTRLIGSGPFKFVSQSSNEINLIPNERYYGGAPRLERLTFKVVTDDNTRFLKMKKGDLDLLINAIPLDKVDEFKRPPLSEIYGLIEEPGLSYNYLAFNLEDPALKDLRVRQAIAYGINVEEIIAHRLNGHAVRATGLLAPVNSYYEPDVQVYPFDPQKAKELLDAAGLPSPGEGNVSKPRLTLELKTSNNAQAVGIGRILQAQLAGIGIQVDLRSYEWGTFYGDIRSGNFRMTTMRWVGIVDPDFYYDVFHSSQAPPKGNNRGRYVSPRIDGLLEAGRIIPDPSKRKAIYAQVQRELAVDLPYISLWHVNNLSLVHHRVSGYRQHPTGSFQSFREIALP